MTHPAQTPLPTTAPLYDGPENPSDVLRWALDRYSPDIALACSFGVEDIAVLHLMKSIREDVRLFALDTGRLPEETYECADRVRRHFDVQIEWFFPASTEVEALEHSKGLFSFRENVENRIECCHIRKVEPLNRAVSGLSAWITGLRRQQTGSRSSIGVAEIDVAHGGIAKINPIADWPSKQVWDYVKEHRLPYNQLHDQGYPSIGCAPCTRAVEPGQDPRAGRWWWERDDHKECGLHLDTARE